MYKILETDSFIEDLETQLGNNTKQIIIKLRAFAYPLLKTNPFYGPNIKKLKNLRPEKYRYRIGDYRFFYEINQEKKIIVMLAADHRNDCY